MRVGRGDVWVNLWEFIGPSQAELGEEAGNHIKWVKLQVILSYYHAKTVEETRHEAESANKIQLTCARKSLRQAKELRLHPVNDRGPSVVLRRVRFMM